MKLLVIGSGLMGSAAAYDMARMEDVESVTLADASLPVAQKAAQSINKLTKGRKVHAVQLDAANTRAATRLMRGHAGVLSAVPYFFNVDLAKAAIESRCNFADLGGNNAVVRKTYALAKQAAKRGVALAPDCGLSPGMASILAGELMRRVSANAAKGYVDSLKLYVGGLPAEPKPPFYYQLVFSVNGLINEFVEPAKVLRGGKIVEIEPLTEPEDFRIDGFPTLTAFHTSGGTSTMPETFAGRVGECFEKTLRYPSHFTMVRSLYDLGMFSSTKRNVTTMVNGKQKTVELTPRDMTSNIFLEKFAGDGKDMTIMRVEAHYKTAHGDKRADSFQMVDHHDPTTKMTSMMRTTAWPAAIVLKMLCDGTIEKRGGIYQETDVPGSKFLYEVEGRGIMIQFQES